MRTFSLLATASVATFIAGTASAVTIDFDSVALGTYTPPVDSGVTFAFTAGDGQFQVTSAAPGFPISGRSLFSLSTNPGPGAFKASISGGFSRNG